MYYTRDIRQESILKAIKLSADAGVCFDAEGVVLCVGEKRIRTPLRVSFKLVYTAQCFVFVSLLHDVQHPTFVLPQRTQLF